MNWLVLRNLKWIIVSVVVIASLVAVLLGYLAVGDLWFPIIIIVILLGWGRVRVGRRHRR